MSEGFASLLQWGGWAAACTLLGGLVAAYLQRRTAKEQAVIQTHAVEVTAEEVRIKARAAETTWQEMAVRTYQGLITALKQRVDELEGRVAALEKREAECLQRLAQVEAERHHDQAEFWRQRHPERD